MNKTNRMAQPTDDVQTRLKSAMDFMSREFRRNPRLSEIAHVAHFSEFHFHRLFRARFGRTPKQVLVDLQIEEVKRLMLAGSRPSDAAKRAGFSHQSHLTSRFRQRMGVTPRQWMLVARKRNDAPVEKKR
jgi:AraC-like DNA-binding protein